MKKEEILEKNKNDSMHGGDEREEFVNGKANIIARGAFSASVILLILFNETRGVKVDDLWGVFFVYCATEALYKYHCLKERKLLISGIVFTICAIISLFLYIFHDSLGMI